VTYFKVMIQQSTVNTIKNIHHLDQTADNLDKIQTNYHKIEISVITAI
jgi:hypothetical protein